MNILLTNDDGFGSEGIEAIKAALKKYGHTVYVMAPSGNRSGVSHGMTFASLDFKKISENEWTCSGKPVDCVVSALRSSIFPEKIDCVVSGINAGANIGTDILYSGTCGAARQAVMYQVPGIALSIEPSSHSSYVDPASSAGKKYDFTGMAEFASKNIEKLAGMCRLAVPYAFVNVNALDGQHYTQAVVTKNIAVRTYHDSVSLQSPDQDGIQKSVFKGDVPEVFPDAESDYAAVYAGKVSVTVVYAEPVACAVDGIGFSL